MLLPTQAPRLRASEQSLVKAALLLLGVYDCAYLALWSLGRSQPPFDDFFGFWCFARFAGFAGHALYDPMALGRFEHRLDPAFPGIEPFPYPPGFALALMPLGLLPLPVAYIVWIAGTFALYVVATLGRAWRSIYGLCLLLAPTTLLTAVAGRTGCSRRRCSSAA